MMPHGELGSLLRARHLQALLFCSLALIRENSVLYRQGEKRLPKRRPMQLKIRGEVVTLFGSFLSFIDCIDQKRGKREKKWSQNEKCPGRPLFSPEPVTTLQEKGPRGKQWLRWLFGNQQFWKKQKGLQTRESGEDKVVRSIWVFDI